MLVHILISVISDDKPGIVEAIAETVSGEEGNWLESRLSQLAGKFAGVIRVAVKKDKLSSLQSKLEALTAQGIWIKLEEIDKAHEQKVERATADVHLLGPDRPGIVRELSKALVQKNINLANLETSLSSMPYSGDPLFEATGQLEIPEDVDLQALHDTLDEIADNLALDISLSDPHS